MSQSQDPSRPGRSSRETGAPGGIDTTDYQAQKDYQKHNYPPSTQSRAYLNYQNAFLTRDHQHQQYNPAVAQAGATLTQTTPAPHSDTEVPRTRGYPPQQAGIGRGSIMSTQSSGGGGGGNQIPHSQSQVLRASPHLHHHPGTVPRSQSQQFYPREMTTEDGKPFRALASKTPAPSASQQTAGYTPELPRPLRTSQPQVPDAVEGGWNMGGTDTKGHGRPNNRVILPARTDDDNERVKSKDEGRVSISAASESDLSDLGTPQIGNNASQRLRQGANARVKDEQRQDDSAMGNPIDARHVELEESLRQDHKRTAPLTMADDTDETILEHPSYHEGITGEEAIYRLRASGHHLCYLTRYSKLQKSYVLTVYQIQQRMNDDEMHFKIVIENERYKIDGTKRDFEDIDHLLEFYEEHRIHRTLRKIGERYTQDEYMEEEEGHENDHRELNPQNGNRPAQNRNRPVQPPQNGNGPAQPPQNGNEPAQPHQNGNGPAQPPAGAGPPNGNERKWWQKCTIS